MSPLALALLFFIMSKTIFFALAALILGFFLFFRFFWPSEEPTISGVSVTIGQNQYIVDVADTPELQTEGLAGRKDLPEGTGLLFVFGRPSTQAFWMKGMLFPIDIVWIADNLVVGFVENAQPDHSILPEVYSSPKPIDLVVELPAGTVSKDEIKNGDKVSVMGYTRK